MLDEPFTGIDPVTIHSIQDIIRGLRDAGIAILLTDHREMETLTITDRSYIIARVGCWYRGTRRRCSTTKGPKRRTSGSAAITTDSATRSRRRPSSGLTWPEKAHARVSSGRSDKETSKNPPDFPVAVGFRGGFLTQDRPPCRCGVFWCKCF